MAFLPELCAQKEWKHGTNPLTCLLSQYGTTPELKKTIDEAAYLKEGILVIQKAETRQALDFINTLSLKSLTNAGKYALFETAVQNDRIDLVDKLHSKMFDSNVCNTDYGAFVDSSEQKIYLNHKALFLDLAVSKKMAEKLIALGADVNGIINSKDETPLYHVKTKEMAQYLKKKGAKFYSNEQGEVFTKKHEQTTPLHTCESLEVAQFLIESYKLKPQDLNRKNESGQSALHVFMWRGFDIAKLLVNKGADVNCQAKDNRTPLHMCAETELAKLLIKHGANVNAIDNWGRTPLTTSHPEIINRLIKSGADLNLKMGANQRTALSYHIEKRTSECARLLIEAGAEISKTDLHLCTDGRIADLLLKKGADINAKDKDGNTPRDVADKAQKANLPNIWNFLCNHGGLPKQQSWRG